MSSGFVSAGGTVEAQNDNDKWAKAKQQVEVNRKSQPSEDGKQEGGKSLYEHLQANKAAKQEAFEEASKLRNQFRPLDDSEVDFLESLQQRERAKEAAVQRETKEQLESFRKERAAAEGALHDKDGASSAEAEAPASTNASSWTATKKRRRENAQARHESPKVRRTSINEDKEAQQDGSKAAKSVDKKTSAAQDGLENHSAQASKSSSRTTANATSSLGLDAYDSEDE